VGLGRPGPVSPRGPESWRPIRPMALTTDPVGTMVGVRADLNLQPTFSTSSADTWLDLPECAAVPRKLPTATRFPSLRC
jgi:hypothetical protein